MKSFSFDSSPKKKNSVSHSTSYLFLPTPMHRTATKEELENELLELEIKSDMLRLRIARREAEKLVLDRGWKKEDEDFECQVEEETKRQWGQEFERNFLRRENWGIDPEEL